MKRVLTKFQVDCEKLLSTSLEKVQKTITNRKVEGKSETFIVGDIKDHNITFWIYEDGADFKTSDMHLVFELPDYGSLNLLAEEFTASLLNAIKGSC